MDILMIVRDGGRWIGVLVEDAECNKLYHMENNSLVNMMYKNHQFFLYVSFYGCYFVMGDPEIFLMILSSLGIMKPNPSMRETRARTMTNEV